MKHQPTPETLTGKPGGKPPKLSENRGKEAEKRENIAMLEKIFRKSPGIILVSENIRVNATSVPSLVYANQAMAHQLGYSVQEMQAMHTDWLIRVTHPDDLHLFGEMDSLAGRYCSNDCSTAVFRLIAKNRKIVRVMLTSCIINPEAFGCLPRFVSTGLVLSGQPKNEEQIRIWMMEKSSHHYRRLLNKLNERNQRIFILIVTNFNDKQIGEKVNLSPGTVKSIRCDMYRLFGVHDRAGLIRIASIFGIL